MWNWLSVSIWAAYKNCSFSNTPFYGNNETSPQGQIQLHWSRIILAPKTIHNSKCEFPYMPDELQSLSLGTLGDEAMEKRKKLLVREREGGDYKKVRKGEMFAYSFMLPCPLLQNILGFIPKRRAGESSFTAVLHITIQCFPYQIPINIDARVQYSVWCISPSNYSD